MTTKPEVVAWRWRKPVVNDQGETVGATAWELGDAPEFLPWWTNEPLIRLSDYEKLARYYKNGINCFANPCERHSGERTPPFAEFFEKYGGQCLICVVDNNKALQAELEQWKNGSIIRDEQNEELHQYVLELKTEIEKLQAESLEMAQVLAECRANDKQAMSYLNQIREIVGGDDFPDMVQRCEQLRKDAEFGRAVLAKREPGKTYGCHCDLDEGMVPDDCVIDTGERHKCIYAKDLPVKEQCDYWRVIACDVSE